MPWAKAVNWIFTIRIRGTNRNNKGLKFFATIGINNFDLEYKIMSGKNPTIKPML